jgi:hypothetical protein
MTKPQIVCFDPDEIMKLDINTLTFLDEESHKRNIDVYTLIREIITDYADKRL